MTNALREWRTENGISLAWLAERLSVRVSTVSRWESGAIPTDADVVDRLESLTGGAVRAADMHAVRLAWLKANRPEKFHEPSEVAA